MATSVSIPNALLQDIYRTNTVVDETGRNIPVRENVSAENANAVYRVVKMIRPQRVLEVGMANGITTLAILTALDELGEDGTIISVDPYQLTDWRSIGLLNVQRAGYSEQHELRAEPDYLALPSLLRECGQTFDFAYLDGWHNFDYTLIDFFYTDKMLRAGGVVGFNDCDWQGVLRATRFVQRHRHYDQLDVGLSPQWGNRIRASDYMRRAIERYKPGLTHSRLVGPILGRRREDRYYRKREDWEPPHGYWAGLGWRPRG